MNDLEIDGLWVVAGVIVVGLHCLCERKLRQVHKLLFLAAQCFNDAVIHAVVPFKNGRRL